MSDAVEVLRLQLANEQTRSRLLEVQMRNAITESQVLELTLEEARKTAVEAEALRAEMARLRKP